jgi:hypothetical protein
MALPTRTFTLAAAAALIALGGASAVSSAPSPVPAKPMTVSDDAFRPGMDGIDMAAITGPKGSAEGRLPACADPARRGDLRPC